MIGESTSSAPWPVALEAIYRQDRLRLLRTAYLICGSRDAAEDILQEAVARVARRWSEVDHGRAYLAAAVANGARDRVRSVRRRGGETFVDDLVAAADPSDAASVDVARALATLSRDHRTAIVLRYFQDWSDEQIGSALGVRPATVRSWLHRARRRLREELEVPDV